MKEIDLKGFAVVCLPGSDAWIDGDTLGSELEVEFPGQDGYELSMAMTHNDHPFTAPVSTLFTEVKLIKQGYNDGPDWLWFVRAKEGDNETAWIVQGGCDYTGWDCQSGCSWTKIEHSYGW